MLQSFKTHDDQAAKVFEGGFEEFDDQETAMEPPMTDRKARRFLKKNKIVRMANTLDNETIFIQPDETHKISTNVSAAQNKINYSKNFGIRMQLPAKYVIDSRINKLMSRYSFLLVKYVFPSDDEHRVATHFIDDDKDATI